MRLLTRKSGFTLLEVLISIGVLTLVGVTMVSVVAQCLNVFSQSESNAAAVNSATIAIQRLSNDIRDGRSAIVSGGTLTVYYPKKITDTTTKESMYDLSAQDPVSRSYYLSQGKLLRNINGQISTVAKDISSITFGASGGTVSITINTTSQIGRETSSQQVVGRITLRNYRY